VREENPDVFFRVGLEITDGIIKNLFSTGLEKPFLFKKSFLYSEDVAVGRAVRGIVSGNAMFPAGNLRNEQCRVLNELRRELWAKAVRSEHLCDFMNAALHRTKPIKCEPDLCGTIFAAAA
jgi:hypothetical protein